MGFLPKLAITCLSPSMYSLLSSGSSMLSSFMVATATYAGLALVDYFSSKKEKEEEIKEDLKALQSKSGYVFSNEQMSNEVDVAKTELRKNSTLRQTLQNASQNGKKTTEPNMAMLHAKRAATR